MLKAMRELFIELPDIDQVGGEDKVGRLNRTMYGCRDASHGWMLDCQDLLTGEGYKVGRANPSLFYNAEANSCGTVHGDDFVVLAPRKALDRMNELFGFKVQREGKPSTGFYTWVCARSDNSESCDYTQ